MKLKKPKKTFRDRTAQSFLKSARIDRGRLLVDDRQGTTYAAQRSPVDPQVLLLADVASGWGAALLMDEWCRAELAWWEAELEALAPAQTVWLLLDEAGVVVGHLASAELATAAGVAHPFRCNNAARRPLPALGERYAPPAPPVRPRMTRGSARD